MTTGVTYIQPRPWKCPCCRRKMQKGSKIQHVRATVMLEGGRKVCLTMKEHPGHQSWMDKKKKGK